MPRGGYIVYVEQLIVRLKANATMRNAVALESALQCYQWNAHTSYRAIRYALGHSVDIVAITHGEDYGYYSCIIVD